MLKNGLTTQLISEMPVPALCPGHVFPATPFCQGRLPCSWKSTWTRKSLSVGFVTYYKVIIGSSLSLGRAVGRLLALKSFWCREQKIKQEWAETSCQRMYWPRYTTHTPWLVCQGAESTWFPVSFPHLLLFLEQIHAKEETVSPSDMAMPLAWDTCRSLERRGHKVQAPWFFWGEARASGRRGIKNCLFSLGKRWEGKRWSHLRQCLTNCT